MSPSLKERKACRLDNFKILTPGLKFLECKKKEKGWGKKREE